MFGSSNLSNIGCPGCSFNLVNTDDVTTLLRVQCGWLIVTLIGCLDDNQGPLSRDGDSSLCNHSLFVPLHLMRTQGESSISSQYPTKSVVENDCISLLPLVPSVSAYFNNTVFYCKS
jgi:hypothetical protein